MEDNIKVTTFAPVFIPTLNRSSHFIRLLESLEKCTWAGQTEVFVSLDYPPAKKYEEGHDIINEYLTQKELDNNFKILHVFRQTKNLGIRGNFDFLSHYWNQYDRHIISEDDNVFSPNFLVFINKGLTKYKDDTQVYAITGYTHPFSFRFSDNSYFMFNNDFSAWGYGTWTSKMNTILEDIHDGGFRRSLSLRNIIKVSKHGYTHLRRYLVYGLSRHPERIGYYDTVLSIYMIVKDMCVICPRLSTVRNEGWDNSGNSSDYVKINIKKERLQYYSNLHMCQQIDTNSDFNYYGNPMLFFDYNNRLAAKESSDKMSFFKFIGSFFSLAKDYVKNR